MTTSDATEAFVWVWLAGATEPVVAGRLNATGDQIVFRYGAAYRARPGAVPLYLPELPMGSDVISPLDGMGVAGCIADAGPDAWGRRVILHSHLHKDADATEDQVGLVTFLLQSGSDRIGGLDFQASSSDYIPRITQAPLPELLTAADRLEQGLPLDPALGLALLHGSSLGGARPKVLVEDGDGSKKIAKFGRRSDTYPVANAEGAVMHLAHLAGLNVAATAVTRCLDTDVLLVDRFDRNHGPGQRRMMVSALTLQQLDERWSRYATYTGLAEQIRTRFTHVDLTLRELFLRIAFNICVGNTDDHARNHAAFWDGTRELLTLTPAFDICPQRRGGGETVQAMAYGADGERRARLEPLVRAARLYHLESADARQLVDGLVEVIHSNWNHAADHARLSPADRELLWGTQILNPSIFYSD